MSDYNFYGTNTPVAISVGQCNLTSPNQFTTSGSLGTAGDVLYMILSDTIGVVAVIQEDTRVAKFDNNIYTSVPSSFTPQLVYYFDSNSDFLSSSVSSFRIESSANVSTYSESYRPYKTSFDYKLIIDTKRRLFFGDIKELIATTWVVFKDGCNGVAYLVSFGEDTFVTLNNKFKSSLDFNIATR